MLASRGDKIHIDGNNTDKYPYSCQSGTSQHPGIYINKTLSLIGSANPMPQIRCFEETGLVFSGSDSAEDMNITISGLLFSESLVYVQDSSVHIDGCKFQGSNQRVEIVIRYSAFSKMLVTNSTFSRNRRCISIVVQSEMSLSPNIQLIFKLSNSSFDGNLCVDRGGCISFYKPESSIQTVSCNVTLDNVIFSNNNFSSGLFVLNINNGRQNIYLQNVTISENAPSSTVLDALGGFLGGEYVVSTNDVHFLVNSSNFRSEHARLFHVTASKISFEIFNSRFFGHNSKGRGGVASLVGAFLCRLKVSKSLFIDTTAAQGGAFNIESSNDVNASIEDSTFYGNKATNDGSGGAVFISASESSLRLSQSAFTECTAGNGGAISIETKSNLPSAYPKDIGLLLTTESSNFTGCSANIQGGALYLIYDTNTQISLNKSLFISNGMEFAFGGGAIWAVYNSKSEKDLNGNTSQMTLEQCTFSDNHARQGGALWLSLNGPSLLLFRHVIMENNRATEKFGGAAVIYDSSIQVQNSRFSNNFAGYGGAFWIIGDVNSLQVMNSVFENNFAASYSGGAFLIQTGLVFLSISIVNSTFNNCSATYNAGAVNLVTGNTVTVSIFIKMSRFQNNYCSSGSGGALRVSSPSSYGHTGIKVQECSKSDTKIRIKKDESKEDTHLFIEDSVFERNTAPFGGAIYLGVGKAAFYNCSFIDNFARLRSGHIHSVFGLASLKIQDTLFRQIMNEFKRDKIILTVTSFLEAENILSLKLYNTTVDVRPYGSTGPFILITNGKLIDVGTNNLTNFNCPVGSRLDILNIIDESDSLSTWQFSCSVCAGNSYSLQRGRAVGSRVVPGFQCLPCPFGANCSQNIIAKPNFWGFQEQLISPKLKFTMCPLGYCRPPDIKDFPKYNGCQGNRSGELCGQCSDGYSETLFSTNCRPSQKCNDKWFWPVALLYVLVMAFYFTFKPPIVPWVKRQVLWFKARDTTDEENEFDRGYLKIIFYFYQAANLLLVSSTSLRIFRTMFAEILVGLFNFQLRVSSGGLICPFPGITVVTKQLFSVSHVFGTCLMIGIIYIVHWGVRKIRGREAPFAGPYIGGILQTMLLGYTTLASVSFDLLRCVPIGSKKQMFYDGNVECFQWWQYMLIVFVCAFVVPFVLVLFWGSFKLYNQTLSGEKLVLACFIPLPSLVYWAFISLIQRRKHGDNKETLVSTNAGNDDTPSINITVNSIKRVLYDSFKRPEVGGKLSLGWESVMIGRRLILVVLKAFVSDPMSRLLVMIFFCVLFFHHHSMIQPFRDSLANRVETISLLFLTVLAILNMFFGSFLSLAATSDAYLRYWWDGCQVLQVIILCAVPTLFCLLVVAAVLSQLSRLIIVAGRFLCKFMWICLSMCDRDQNDERRQLRLVT